MARLQAAAEAAPPAGPAARRAVGAGDGENGTLIYQLIGLREKLQENPLFHGKIYGFL